MFKRRSNVPSSPYSGGSFSPASLSSGTLALPQSLSSQSLGLSFHQPTSTPTTPNAYSNQSVVLDRATLYKTLAGLSALLVTLDQYRDQSAKLAATLKTLGKQQEEIGKLFGSKVATVAQSSPIGRFACEKIPAARNEG